ncbi:exodeoxyribonuclease III [Candidatus Woesearchaeota archaeon]|nr:MAG: exodeoxyribonuclease III [Candidatus Woesearchaeota archaeon]
MPESEWKLLSWNVNGIRAVEKKGFVAFVERERPDVLCVQETKIHEPHPLPLKGFVQFWNCAERRGYSGTALFSKRKPLKVAYDFGEHAGEGRVITAEFDWFFVVNVYVPNAQHGLPRLPYRMKWDRDFLQYLRSLRKKKPVVVCGDFNVAHKEIDLKNPGANRKNPGFTDEERAGMDAYIKAGFVDSFREFEKGPGHYTWWSYRFNARARNIGWRIDYVLVSEELRPFLKKAFILKDVQGSDHCPVGVVLDLGGLKEALGKR